MKHPTVFYTTPCFLRWLRLQEYDKTVNLLEVKYHQFNFMGAAGTFKIDQRGSEIRIYLYSTDQKPPDAIWTTWINTFNSWQKAHWPKAPEAEFFIIVTDSLDH